MSPQPDAKGDEGRARIGELALAELRMNARSPGYRVLGLFVTIAAVLMLAVQRYTTLLILDPGPLAQHATRGALETLVPILSPPLVCGAALRERRLGMEELLLSKPPSSEMLLWSKFLGLLGALLLLIPVACLAVVLAQLFLFRGAPAVMPVLVGGYRAVAPVLFSAGISFALATYARTSMIGILASTVPIAIVITSSYLVPALRFTLTPYHLTYALLGIASVAAVAGWWEAGRQPERRVARSWAAGGAALAVGLAAGAVSVHAWRGWSFDVDPALVRVAEWKGEAKSRLPGTPLRTIDGSTVRLSQWQGRPIVLLFWSTDAPGSASEAAVLEQAWRETARDEVGFLAVCITDDPLRAGDIARAVDLQVPVIWNPPPQFGAAAGLAERFAVSDAAGKAHAGWVRADGSVAGQAVAVSQVDHYPGRPAPHRDWERRLHELAVAAFREIRQAPGARRPP